MASTPESQLKFKIKAYLDTLKPWVWWDAPVRNGYSKRGPADIHGCACGFFFGIETKKQGGKMDPWQIDEHIKMRAAGGFTMECDTWESFLSQWQPFFEKVMQYARSNA